MCLRGSFAPKLSIRFNFSRLIYTYERISHDAELVVEDANKELFLARRAADAQVGDRPELVGVRGIGEAVDRVRVAVDAGCEGGVVAGFEGVGGVGEEGDDRGGGGVEGGAMQGSVAVDIGCAQRQRVLADQELDNGGVAEVASSVMKGRVPTVIGESQQAPLPRVELGLRYHQLNEFQWRRVDAGPHVGRASVVALVEDLIDCTNAVEALELALGRLPPLVQTVVMQRMHRPAARVSVRSGGVCLSLV